MASGSLMVFTGNANPKLAADVVRRLGMSLGSATVGRFSDGEVNVELLENVRGKDVFVHISAVERAGLTGLWQVSGRNETTYAERVALDAWYVKNWNLWYDIAILCKTVRTVLTGKGAY